MKAKIFLAATLMLALAIGTVNANPTTEVNKAETASGLHKDGKMPMKHHHHRHHHHHHMMKH